jgi:large subunit ribosomal protein L6
MSRIGNRVLTVPEGVTVTNENGCITVKGPKGELSLNTDANISVLVEGNEIKVTRNSETKKVKQMHGTTNALIANMIKGVKDGYEKSLEIIGVGYRFNVKGKTLEISAGYSHKVELEIPEGLSVESASATEITVKGIDKEAVGKFAAEIREVRKPEPYKGKGIRYKGEYVRRKEGKKASK